MAIWSLTQERVDKLLSKIRETETELDKLIKTTPKDMWRKDLDEFLVEWKVQLDQEAKTTKKRAQMGRRASAKLKIGGKPGGKKRKPNDGDDYSDSDFGPPKAKKSVVNRAQPKSSTLTNYLGKSSSSKDPAPKPLVNAIEQKPVTRPPAENVAIALDASQDSKSAVRAEIEKSKAVPKVTKNIDLSDDSDDMDDEFMEIAKEANARQDAAAPTRKGRAARAKPAKYILSDDSDSNGDDMLGDVSTMVKGIGSRIVETGRPLFSASASRPSSAHGLPKTVGRPSRGLVDTSSGADETDYAKLAPQESPHRPAIRPTKTLAMSDDNDSDDSDDLVPSKSAVSGNKTNNRGKPAAGKSIPPAKPKPSKAAKSLTSSKPDLASKQTTLSPTAKAYMAQQAKSQSTAAKIASKKSTAIDSDDDDDDDDDKGVNALAHELISDDDEPPKVNARPGRRAVVSKAKYALSDDDDSDSEETDFDGDDDDMTD